MIVCLRQGWGIAKHHTLSLVGATEPIQVGLDGVFTKHTLQMHLGTVLCCQSMLQSLFYKTYPCANGIDLQAKINIEMKR
jgi:hypothetical protein